MSRSSALVATIGVISAVAVAHGEARKSLWRAFKAWQEDALALQPLAAKGGPQKTLPALKQINRKLFDAVVKAKDFSGAVNVNGALVLLGEDGEAVDITGGVAGYHRGLFFINEPEMKSIARLGARGPYLDGLVGKRIRIIAPAKGCYGLHLNADGEQEPSFERGRDRQGEFMRVTSKRGFDPRIGVMVYDLPQERVSAVLGRSDRAGLQALLTKNLLPATK